MPTAAAVAATSAHAAQTEARHVLAGRALFDRLESALAASRLPARRALSAAAALGRLRGTLSGRWPAVSIGSYPQLDVVPHTVTITMDSREPAALEACEAWLRDRLADGLLP